MSACLLGAAASALHPSSSIPSLPGREAEQAALSAFLRACVERARTGSLLVCGSPGVGKTASLALATAALSAWAPTASLRAPFVHHVNGMSMPLDHARVCEELQSRMAAAERGAGLAPARGALGEELGGGAGRGALGAAAPPRAPAPQPPPPARPPPRPPSPLPDAEEAQKRHALAFGLGLKVVRRVAPQPLGRPAPPPPPPPRPLAAPALSPAPAPAPAAPRSLKRERPASPARAAAPAAGDAAALLRIAALATPAYVAAARGVALPAAASPPPLHILVLDEADALSGRSAGALSALFHLPFRRGSRVVLVCVSNDINLAERIGGGAQPPPPPAVLVFPAYSAPAMARIITERLTRAEAALRGAAGAPPAPPGGAVVDPKAVELLCKRIAARDGDVRKALYLARKAVQSAAEAFCSGAGGGGEPAAAAAALLSPPSAAPARAAEAAGGGGAPLPPGSPRRASPRLAESLTRSVASPPLPLPCACFRGGEARWRSPPPGAPAASAAAAAAAPPAAAAAAAAAFAVRIPDVMALLAAALESRYAKALSALPVAAAVLICAARGLAEREGLRRAQAAAFAKAAAEVRATGGTCGTFEGAALSFGHVATAAGAYKGESAAAPARAAAAAAALRAAAANAVAVPIGALRDSFSRLCRKQLLSVVDARDFSDLIDRLESSGLVAVVGRVGKAGGGGGGGGGAGGRMRAAGGARVAQADAWAQK
jgi:Cdc6-like AAA superfamily ATPase